MGLKILTLFRDLRHFDAVYPQFKAIADVDEIETFHVVYTHGYIDPSWIGLSFHQLKTQNSPSILLDAIASRDKFCRLAEDLDIDVFYALNDGWMQEYARYASQKIDKPFVIKVRGNYRNIDAKHNRNPIYQALLNFIRRRSFREADRIIPISEFNRNQILDWNLVNHYRVSEPIPNGVDFELFHPDKQQEHHFFTVTYIGRLSPEKGVDVLLEVIRRLPRVHFIIAGLNQMNLDIEKLPSNTEYMGRVPYTQIPYIYGESDAIILTSHTEGFTNLLPEAYSMETPLITHKEIYPHEIPVNGIIVNQNTPDQYVDAIEKILRGEYMRFDSREYVKKNLTWKHYGEKTVCEILQAISDNYNKKINAIAVKTFNMKLFDRW